MNQLPRICFWLTLAVALGLAALTLLAPLAADGSLILKLFAHDAMLRRTALASGLALVVTAWVFFRPPAAPRPAARPERPVPPPVIGA